MLHTCRMHRTRKNDISDYIDHINVSQIESLIN